MVRRLKVRDFRRFGEAEFEFGPGVTSVCGRNEAGKSTLRKAILIAFYEKPQTTSKAVRDLTRWGSSKRFAVEVEFEADGRGWRLEKDFESKRALLEPVDGPGRAGRRAADGGGNGSLTEVVDDPDEIQRMLAGWLGCPNSGFFEATACVAHGEMARIDKEPGHLTERLQQLVTGGQDAAPQALKRLDAAMKELRKGHRGTAKGLGSGNLAYWEARITELEAGRDELEEGVRTQRERAAALARAVESRGELEAEVASVRDVVARAEALERLDHEIAELEAPYQRSTRAQQLTEESARAERRKEDFARFGKRADTVERLDALAERLSLAERNVTQATVTARSAAAQAPPARLAPGLAVAGLGVVAILAGTVLGVLRGGWWWWVLLAGGLAVLGGVAAAARARTEAHHTAEDVAERYVAQMEDAVVRARDEFDRALAEVGVADPGEARRGLEEYRKAERDAAAVRARLDEVLGGDRAEDLAALARENAVSLLQKKDARDSIAKLLPDEALLRGARERLAAAEEGLRRQTSEADRLSGLVSAGGADPDALSAAEEGLAAARERSTILQRRLAVYERARAGIDAAQHATLQTVTPALEEAIGRYVSLITEGRYEAADVDERTLAISTIDPQTGQATGVEDEVLSHGTRDQFYLAARVGLVGLVCGEARPPLILDEPFAGFDDDRARAAWRLLEEIGRDYQVIVLSCRTGAPSGAVLELPGP